MPGIFGDQTIRLLREEWPNPTMLAQELFSMFSSTNPVTIPGNSTITAPVNSMLPYLSLAGYTTGNTLLQINSPGLPPIMIGLNPDGTLGTDTATSGGGGFTPTAASGAIPGMVQSGTGSTYLVTIYPNGLSKPSQNVTVNQLQIDPGATIPSGTWVLVSKSTDGSYNMQAPVWM